LHLRAKVREKGRLHDTRLEPAIRTIYPFVAYENQNTDAIIQTGAAINKSLASLDLLLSHETLDQKQLWMCDCGFAVAFAWIKAFEQAVNLNVTWPEAVSAYDARLRNFDAVQDELTAYKPAMDGYLTKAKPPQA
ncbi:MAG: glutathione S-transferase, partial [Litoreibacter sp.]